MDDPVPTIDFSPAGGLDSPYSFERSDVDCTSTVQYIISTFKGLYLTFMTAYLRPNANIGRLGDICPL